MDTLKKLSINIKDNIILYDYKKSNIITYNNLNRYLNFILNNDLNYYYVFIIDYSNKQINIDIYNNNKKTIFYNICYDLYYNKDAFKTLNDFILNNNKDYKIITINKAFLNIE